MPATSSAQDLAADLAFFDERAHAALEADRAAARARAVEEARATATTEAGAALITAVVLFLQRAGMDAWFAVSLSLDEVVARLTHVGSGKLVYLADERRRAAEDALRGAGFALAAIACPKSVYVRAPARPLLAADPEYRRLMDEALQVFAALGGDLSPGVVRLGGPVLLRAVEVRELVERLQFETMYASRGNVPKVAVEAAQLARDIAVVTMDVKHEARAWDAAGACMELARYANEWALKNRSA